MLRELESLGVVGSRWESLGDIGRHKQRVLGEGWSRWESLGVVEEAVVYSQTNHLGRLLEPQVLLFVLRAVLVVARQQLIRGEAPQGVLPIVCVRRETLVQMLEISWA